MAILYLEKDALNRKGFLSCQSEVCLFVTNVLFEKLQNLPYTVKIVSKDSSKDIFNGEKSVYHNINISSSYSMLSFEDCPNGVRFCELPVLVTSCGQIIHCGLCSVVRKIVKMVHEQMPHLQYNKLLGHHEMCLRACAEVSVWTKFCEVEMPELVQQIRKCSVDDDFMDIPKELIKLEQHFKSPAVIPQVGKRKQQIYHILTSKNTKKRPAADDNWIEEMNALSLNNYIENYNPDSHKHSEILKVLSTNKNVATQVEVPGLEHWFAEGADLTLTDLVLLPCVTQVLYHMKTYEKHWSHSITGIRQWYNRMTSLSVIKDAMHKAGLPVVEHTLCEAVDRSIESTPSSSKLVKQKIKVSTPDASRVLDLLQDVELTVQENPVYSNDQNTLNWDEMPTSVHPIQGNLPESRVSRKCEQLENLALAVKCMAHPGQVIVDFCAGGGHLGILVAHLLPDCHVFLVENKEESIRRAYLRVKEMGLQNITIFQSNLDYFNGTFDIGMCLHACGVATDLVMNKCIEAKASFVVCPCCYGGVQNTHILQFPRSQHYKKNLTYEEYLLLTHAADDQKTGKTFMVAVDYDRAMFAEQNNYDVTVCELKPLTCSPKNNLLIGYKKTVPL